MAAIELHPSELAYAFAYMRTEEVIGWGMEPFLPPEEADASGWLAEGEARLLAAGRLSGVPEDGLAMEEALVTAFLALADPGIVLMGQRREGEGVQTLTVHARGEAFIGLALNRDGMVEMTRYEDLTAGAGACASFTGVALAPLEDETRIEAKQAVLARLRDLAAAGEAEKVVAALMRLGAEDGAARSAHAALSDPAMAGVLSVLYCAKNTVEDAETFSVLTTAAEESWVLFAPADLEGPMILERSSVAALTARVAVRVASRFAVTPQGG
ncbi:MAG: hypothetical protein AAFU49_05800 [Pseudomonadota bacterium]